MLKYEHPLFKNPQEFWGGGGFSPPPPVAVFSPVSLFTLRNRTICTSLTQSYAVELRNICYIKLPFGSTLQTLLQDLFWTQKKGSSQHTRRYMKSLVSLKGQAEWPDDNILDFFDS